MILAVSPAPPPPFPPPPAVPMQRLIVVLDVTLIAWVSQATCAMSRLRWTGWQRRSAACSSRSMNQS